MSTEEELRKVRLGRAQAILDLEAQPYANEPRATDAMEQARRTFVGLANDEDARAALPTEKEIDTSGASSALYGRVVARRGPFLVLRTPYGDAQALVRKDELDEQQATLFKKVDLADHVWVEGHAFRTATGAAALRATSYRHLSKALLPPPEKWHGLRDVEKRYRERYVDLFANPDVTQVFRARSLIIDSLRDFLKQRDFIEVETPLLHPLRGGATARPFKTHHNALDSELYLRVAPELYLKRLLVGGLDRVFELGRVFRNEGVSTRHNPEFTILEFYQAYATYEELMELTEQMLRKVDQELGAAFPGFAQERSFRLDLQWPRVTMRQAIVDALKDIPREAAWANALGEADVFDSQQLAQRCQSAAGTAKGPDAERLAKCKSYGQSVFILFELLAEPRLTKTYRTEDGLSLPVFITEYPFEISPLARRNDQDPAFVDRFELYLEGRELANAFSELNDPEDQAARFRAQLEMRAGGDEEAMDYDADYIRALSHGMPPAAGFGLGVDRLVMSLCTQPSIRDVLLFPLMRSLTS